MKASSLLETFPGRRGEGGKQLIMQDGENNTFVGFWPCHPMITLDICVNKNIYSVLKSPLTVLTNKPSLGKPGNPGPESPITWETVVAATLVLGVGSCLLEEKCEPFQSMVRLSICADKTTYLKDTTVSADLRPNETQPG